MGSSLYIPSFSLSSFAQDISKPYTSMNAYTAGAIDADGNLLKPESSIDGYEYFVIKIKKIIDQVPTSYTKAALNSYASAFKYFTEEAATHGMDSSEFLFFIEGYLTGLICEDMTTGAAPGALGTPAEAKSEGGVMGYERILGAPSYSGAQMFDVSRDDFDLLKQHKAWKHVPDGDTKKYLQRFQRRNKDAKIAVRSTNPETGKQEVHWIKMKPMSFMEEFKLDNLSMLFENVRTTKQGYNAGNVIERLLSNIGAKEDYDVSKLNQHETEYVGRMIDWVNGFHAASSSGEEGHAEEWIDLGHKNSIKKASTNDSKGPKAAPDGFRYDPTVKSKSFKDRLVKVDYGTDRKPVGELSRKRKGIELGGQMIPLPKEGSKFKEKVKELIGIPEIEGQMRGEMISRVDMPQIIAHKTTTDTRKLLPQRGFLLHPLEQLRNILKSRLFNISPYAGKPTENEPYGRQVIKSLDLRKRSRSSPSVGSEMGYDEIRSIPGGDAPKEAISVSLEALDNLFDQIPDTYRGENGINKDTLRERATKILAPHMEKGRYPLELPSSKTIST